MHPNLLLVPTFAGAGLLCLLGLWVFEAVRSKFALVIWCVLAAALSVPALLFVAYYGHGLDRAAWYFSFRAAPYTELLGLGLGLALGALKRFRFQRDSSAIRLSAPLLVLLCAGLLSVPYLKPVIAPIEAPYQDKWVQGVSLQSTPSTCGPSSAATLLRLFHISASEQQLARECFSYQGGTESWYVMRALRRRGLEAHTLIFSPQTANLPFPAIAGVQIGGPGQGGHFITVLGRSGDSYIIGDPMVGRLVLTPERLHSRYYFTGFFLVVSKPV